MTASEIKTDPQVALCFLFVGLSIGCFTTYVLSRFAPNIPYAVVVFLSGILCAIGAMLANFRVLGDSIYQWMDLEPHILLYIFLPALIFGDAMSLNIHHMLGTFGSGVLLGIPGSVIGTLCLALFTKYVLPYEWTWGLSLLVGAILNATDTVSVFAVLKQADAPPRLTSLIVQESLYNDGAALVLFNIFFTNLKIYGREGFDPFVISIYCLKILTISPLLGISLGLMTVFFLRIANRKYLTDDVTIQVAVTMCCAYLSFFVGEYVLEVSGVIACCTAGITLAWLGPPLILLHETMHSVWSMMEWMGNTLIFLIAGLLFVIKTQQGITTYLNFTGQDFALIFLIYFAVLGSRAVMVICCYPFMSSSWGSKVTVKECLFLTWCGVRGAVGIVLALVLDESAAKEELIVPHKTAHRVFFLVGGVATLTLVINATLAKKVLFGLGLVEETSEEIRMMQHYARKRIHKRVNDVVKQLKKDLPPFDIYLVAEYCKVVVVNSLHPGSTRGFKGKSRINTLVTKAGSIFGSVRGSVDGREDNISLMPDSTHSCRTNVRVGMSEGMEEMVRILTTNDTEEKDTDPSVDSNITTNSKSYLLPPLRREATGSIQIHPAAFRRSSREVVQLDLSMLKTHSTDAQAAMDNSSSAIFTQTSRVGQLLRSVGELATGMKVAKKTVQDSRLLTHVRLAFLGVVRMVYWKLIDEGKLPRNSSAALALLYSVDFAQDAANSPNGLQDWDALQPALNHTSILLRILLFIAYFADCFVMIINTCSCFTRSRRRLRHLETIPEVTEESSGNGNNKGNGIIESKDTDGKLPPPRVSPAIFDRKVMPSDKTINSYTDSTTPSTRSSNTFFSELVSARVEFRTQENNVYVLTSFIEAHEHAQKMIALYLGEDEVTTDTMEQVKIVEESEGKLALARKALKQIDRETMSYSVSRQVARILLHTQEEMVEQLQKEGILRPRDASELLLETKRENQMLEGEWVQEVWNNLMGISAMRYMRENRGRDDMGLDDSRGTVDSNRA